MNHELTRMNTNSLVHKELSYRIIGLAMEVHSNLGPGFLEKVYENALMVLMRREGITAEQQAAVKVMFEGEVVGEYFADILVDNQIILELKAADQITNIHKAQTFNYLKATGHRLGIILNFGAKHLEHHRIVL